MVAKAVRAVLIVLIRTLERSSIRFLLAVSGLTYASGWLLGFFGYRMFPFEPPEIQIHNPGVIHIFVHNLRAMAPLASGIVTAGFSTFFSLIFNGMVAGYAVASATMVLSWVQVGLRILPHGLFEIPGTLLWGCRL